MAAYMRKSVLVVPNITETDRLQTQRLMAAAMLLRAARSMIAEKKSKN